MIVQHATHDETDGLATFASPQIPIAESTHQKQEW